MRKHSLIKIGFSDNLFLFCAKPFRIPIIISCIFATACSDRSPLALQATTSNRRFAENAININTASLDELQRIPHVGEKLAARIIEHRKVNGPFRRVEHLMLISGISDKRFRKIRPLVRVE